jgi:hypothetical protein
VEHPVPVERVVALERADERVLRVADVEAREVLRELALDDLQRVRVVLDEVRSPGARPIGVIIRRGEPALERLHGARRHP